MKKESFCIIFNKKDFEDAQQYMFDRNIRWCSKHGINKMTFDECLSSIDPSCKEEYNKENIFYLNYPLTKGDFCIGLKPIGDIINPFRKDKIKLIMKKIKFTEEEAVKILTEIGFTEIVDNHGKSYEFHQEYPKVFDEENPHGSNLYVHFYYYDGSKVVFNCHNFGTECHIEEIKNTKYFLNKLDYIVLCGKDSWIYTDAKYNILGAAATEQRKRYFDIRNKMNILPAKKISNYINEHGLEHQKNVYDKIYKGKRIGEMTHEELINVITDLLK